MSKDRLYECALCGSAVVNAVTHSAWHASMGGDDIKHVCTDGDHTNCWRPSCPVPDEAARDAWGYGPEDSAGYGPHEHRWGWVVDRQLYACLVTGCVETQGRMGHAYAGTDGRCTVLVAGGVAGKMECGLGPPAHGEQTPEHAHNAWHWRVDLQQYLCLVPGCTQTRERPA